MSELKPCPFCGGEAETHEVTFPYHYWDVLCDGECFDHFCEKPTEAEAIEAWNTRAERTCRNLSGDFAVFCCSVCGYFERDCACANYCPNCGAKVVSE